MKRAKIKGIFVILDGLGDLECRQLENKTPLEAAKTPHLDFLATRGEMGQMYPVRPNYIPGSDEAIVSIFGNELKNSTRGQLESRGAGIKLKKGDVAFRCNFSTIDSLEKGNILDRRAGRTLTTKEAKELAKSINKIKFPNKFEFISTNQHRGALVFKGNFSDSITGNDLTYHHGTIQEMEKITNCMPLKKDKKSFETSEMVNEFLEEIYQHLKNHPINLARKKKGLLPANYLLIRGPGIEKPKLKQYKNWISANYMPLEKGFSNTSGMKNFSFEYPKLKGLDSYKNLWEGLKKATKHSIKIIKKNLKKAEYVYIHIKETDLPGHDNKPLEKKLMLEYIDKTLIKYLAKICPPKKIKLIVTGDHSTPCKLKAHSSDPVPVLFYNGSIPKEKKHFNEKEAKKGQLKRFMGKDIFKKTSFLK